MSMDTVSLTLYFYAQKSNLRARYTGDGNGDSGDGDGGEGGSG